MKTYTVRWYRGQQSENRSSTAEDSGLLASRAYRKAIDCSMEPGCRLLGVSRDTDGSAVTVRQLRAWGRIGKMNGGAL
jgi:hypothetical protein